MTTIELDEPQARMRATPRPLTVGIVAPPWYEVPPRGYGGTEAVVAGIVDGLVDLGHHVVLVASGPPHTKATSYIRAFDRSPSELLGRDSLPEVILAAEAQRSLAAYDLDVVHDHSRAGPLLARGRSVPTVATVHGRVSGLNAEYYARLGREVDLVSISQSQRALAPALNWVGTVYNAIDVSTFPLRRKKTDALLWVGRFSPDKGAHLAIAAARASDRPLVLAGRIHDEDERSYFDAVVKPRLSREVEYVGEADMVAKRELFGRSTALLFPIQWEEPFGMVMIESMACGTPVVALRRGSVPEVVEDGVTGYVVDDSSALPDAIGRASALDPVVCRRRVEERFDLPVMARGYERVYRSVLEAEGRVIRAGAYPRDFGQLTRAR